MALTKNWHAARLYGETGGVWGRTPNSREFWGHESSDRLSNSESVPDSAMAGVGGGASKFGDTNIGVRTSRFNHNASNRNSASESRHGKRRSRRGRYRLVEVFRRGVEEAPRPKREAAEVIRDRNLVFGIGLDFVVLADDVPQNHPVAGQRLAGAVTRL